MSATIATNVPRDSVSDTDHNRVSFLTTEKSKPSASDGKQFIVWMVVCFGAIGGILFGMDQANFAGVIPKKSFVDDFCSAESKNKWGTEDECRGGYINDTKEMYDVPPQWTDFLAWGGSLIQLGAAAGALLFAPFITRGLGRRAGLSAGCAVVLGAMVWSISTTNSVSFYFSRFVTGLGAGMVTFTLPMWTAELAPAKIRGTLGCTMQLACVIGSQIAFGINIPDKVTWQHSLGAPIIPAAIVMLFIFCFPESPRYVLQHKGVDAARQTLAKLRGTDDVNAELNEIEQSLRVEDTAAPWHVLWTDKSIRKRFIIANMLQWMQQFTGINALLGHGPNLFLKAGVPMHENTAGFVSSAFNLVGTIVMMVIIDKKGRRPLLLAGAVGMFTFMFPAGLIATFLKNDYTGGYLLLACVCLYFFSFAVAWGGIPWVYPAEIFPMDIKEKALSTSVFSQWIANVAIAQITPRQIDAWGVGATFFFYSAFIVFNFLFVYFYIPEVKGISIEDMDSVFGPRTYVNHRANQDLEYQNCKTPAGVAAPVKSLEI